MSLIPSLLRVLLLGLVVTLASAVSAYAAVLPPDAHPYGKSYGEWSAQWWTQAVRAGSEPGEPFASGAVDCASIGFRHVVFLVGTTGGTAARSCEIPKGSAILVPLVNGECSELEGNGSTDAQLRACANELADSIDVESLFVAVDGVSIEGLDAFRFESELFTWTAAADNAFGFEAGISTRSVADGYYVMLTPLPKGTHTCAVWRERCRWAVLHARPIQSHRDVRTSHDRRLDRGPQLAVVRCIIARCGALASSHCAAGLGRSVRGLSGWSMGVAAECGVWERARGRRVFARERLLGVRG